LSYRNLKRGIAFLALVCLAADRRTPQKPKR